MPPSIQNRRIAPASGAYQRRSRMLLVLAPTVFFSVFAGATLWWFAEDMGLPLPSWSGRAALLDDQPLSNETRGDLRTQLELLQTQWRRLDALDVMQRNGKPLPLPAAAVALSLQPPGALNDGDLRERVDILSKALDGRLFASKPAKSGSGRLMPVNGVTPSSNFGTRLDPFSKKLSVHNGIDFVAPIGTPIHAAQAGTVKSAGLTPQFGWNVELDHGNGMTTRYAHAYRLWVRPGDQVSEGQKIAEVGSTGKSTGPHLHFEVRYNGTPLNPMRYLAAR